MSTPLGASAASPAAGSTTEVQYNLSGVLAGSSGLTWNDTDKKLIVTQNNSTSPALTAINESQSVGVNFFTYSSGNAAHCSRFTGTRTRGSLSAPRRVQLNDDLFRLNATGAWAADDNTDATVRSTASAVLQLLADENWENNKFGTRLQLSLTTAGQSLCREKFRITNDGKFVVGDSGGSYTNKLEVKGDGATSSTSSLLIKDSTSAALFTIRDDGGYAFKGGTVGLAQTGYTISNVSTDRTFDANSTTLDEIADVLGTLIADLITKGIIAA